MIRVDAWYQQILVHELLMTIEPRIFIAYESPKETSQTAFSKSQEPQSGRLWYAFSKTTQMLSKLPWLSVSLMKQKGNFSNISQNYQSCHAKIQFFQLKKTICPIPQKFLQYLTGSLQMKWTRGSRKKMVLNKIISYLKKEGRKEKLKVIYIFLPKGGFAFGDLFSWRDHQRLRMSSKIIETPHSSLLSLQPQTQ